MALLARPHSACDLLLPPPRHRRHHERELRRRVDRRHHRAVRLRHGARIDVARRPAGAAAARRATWRPASRRVSRWTARAVLRASRSRAPCGSRSRPAIPCCRFTSRPTAAGPTNSWDRTQIPKPFATVCDRRRRSVRSAPPMPETMGSRRARRELEARLQGARSARAADGIGRVTGVLRSGVPLMTDRHTVSDDRARICWTQSRAAVPKLRALSVSRRPRGRARRASGLPKQIIGHLIDSASNNHQRFVRAQQGAALTFPPYAQDHWVACQRYGDRPVGRHRDVVARVHRSPGARHQQYSRKIGATCRASSSRASPVTLGFLASDYGEHLRHHLAQVGVLP
mgnify:CR=1 FL=1